MDTRKNKVLPYKQGSRSAKALAEALGIKVLKLVGSKWKPSSDSVVINWGNTQDVNKLEGFAVLNRETQSATNKLLFFQKLKEFTVSPEIEQQIYPFFWTDKNYIPTGAYPVVCRTILNGHSGAGIVIANGPDGVVGAPLYVQYIKKQKEFRIHVGKKTDGTFVIISEQQKVVKSGTEPSNWQIRSHANGFIFQRQGINVPVSVRAAAIRALEASGLDFGAVDCILTKGGRAYVLEINTAPGLEGQTVIDYANFFKDFLV
jgi:glutathione synthase/RimK-type ligase-like ATP-grasp enzyme